MLHPLVERLKKHGVWHLLWFTVLFSEVLTGIMNIIMSNVWWGGFSLDLFLIGAIDALIVSLIAASVAIFLLNNLIRSEKDAKEEVGLLNEQLERRVHERTSELGESEAKYRLLMEQASDGIFIIDLERRFIAVNSKAGDMLGYSKDELLSLKADDIIIADESKLEQRFNDLQDGRTIIREYSLRRKDGTVFPVEVSVKMADAFHVQAIVRDITERKKAEEEKERMQARLTDAQKMEAVGRLAGGIAHDFNNLLTVIKGESSAMLGTLDEHDRSHESVTRIYLSATTAAELVRKLLVFSRQQPMQPVMLDLNKTVAEMMSILKRLIGEDISVAVSLSPDLWTAKADKVSVEQVIMNLVVNAKDAMPSGGRIFIRTGNRQMGQEECRLTDGPRPGRFVFLEVEDTGIGMDRELARNIYEPFYSSKEMGKGTGLGLSVVYGIVEQHNGWIKLETEPGKGSKFSVFLEAAQSGLEPSEVQSLKAGGLAGGGERILFVEDEEGIINFAGRLLERNGYRVFPATDVQGALELFERERGDFSLVLTDLILPDESGIELIDRLHRVKPGLPVLLSSGYSDHRTQWPVIVERGYKLLEKPYTANGLLAAVHQAIHNPPANG